MALSTPSESPAVVVKEIDLTGGVPNVQSTTGAIVINSRWGTVEERVKLSSEAELVEKSALLKPNSLIIVSLKQRIKSLKESLSRPKEVLLK